MVSSPHIGHTAGSGGRVRTSGRHAIHQRPDAGTGRRSVQRRLRGGTTARRAYRGCLAICAGMSRSGLNARWMAIVRWCSLTASISRSTASAALIRKLSMSSLQSRRAVFHSAVSFARSRAVPRGDKGLAAGARHALRAADARGKKSFKGCPGDETFGFSFVSCAETISSSRRNYEFQ